MGVLDKTESIAEEMLEITERESLTREQKEELVENTSDEFRMEPWEVEDTFQEVGTPICQDGDGELFIPEEHEGKGTSVYISGLVCKEHDAEKVGTFHTHPTPPVSPSQPDVRHLQREGDEFGCIGAVAGDTSYVVCFDSDVAEQTDLKRTMQGLMTGSTNRMTGEEMGDINIWHDKSPTAREILDDEGIIEHGAEHSDKTVAELKEELREGHVPRELQADHHPQEPQDITVFEEDAEKDQIQSDISSLKRNLGDGEVKVFKEQVE